MKLSKLFETQRILDERIMEQHPELRGQNNLDWKILALQVELGECANEWRGFQKWSNYQKPRKIIHTTEGATTENAVFYQCGDDDCGKRFYKGDDRLNDLFGKNDEDCPVCEDGLLYAFRKKNPLLEEYVDCLHFILSIGLELIIQDRYADEVNFNIGSRTKRISADQCFKNMFIKVALVSALPIDEEYMELLSTFTTLGDSLGFDEYQVEQAYYEKNEINHERQTNGY